MPQKFLTDDGQQALLGVLRDLEGRSSAELVIAVRPSSGSYPAASLLAGTLAGFLTLAFLLYSPVVFPLLFVLIDPFLVGGLVALLCSRLRSPRRLLSRRRTLDARVRRAAHATFFEKSVHETEGRTGILLYLSLLERRAEVVVDRGVREAVPLEEWNRAAAEIDRRMARGAGAAEIARAAEALTPILELALVRAPDGGGGGGGDVNELADEVCVS
ncbi:MAG: hypothetical protein AAF725_26435 [Acidobacteriota bacterium]